MDNYGFPAGTPSSGMSWALGCVEHHIVYIAKSGCPHHICVEKRKNGNATPAV